MSAGTGNTWHHAWQALMSARQSPPPIELALAFNGGTRLAPRLRPGYEQADYDFHKAVIDDITGALRGAGVTVISEVDLVAIDGRTARIDFMGRLGASNPVCTEVKTSLAYQSYGDFTGNEFRRSQASVFALIPIGNHIASPNAKVARIGLQPDTPFPPLRLDIIYALPGKPYFITTIDPGTPLPPR